MSSLRSSRRKLNPTKVWLANQVAEEKVKIARQVVVERAKKDAQFAADVLKAVGEGLPKEIKEACEESIKQKDIKDLLTKETKGLVSKWEKTGLLDGNPPPTSSMSVLIESESKQIIMPEDTIHGKTITREQALAGLGNPSEWDAFAKEVEKDFKAKPIVGGDTTHELTETIQLDGGGEILVRPEDLPDYPRDGEKLILEQGPTLEKSSDEPDDNWVPPPPGAIIDEPLPPELQKLVDENVKKV